MEHSVIGYHGTSTPNFHKISENNFLPSIGDSHWLGDGTYFFINGVPNSFKSDEIAAKWVEAEAWDKLTKTYKYKNCCVLSAIIKVNEDFYLDLTTFDGMEIFNYHRKRLLESLNKSKKRIVLKSNSPIFRDGELINHMRKVNGIRIDVVKAHFYFKFKEERILQADFRLPNCTVVSVYDCNKNIEKNSIELIRNFIIR